MEPRGPVSGERVRNTWVIYPEVGDSWSKGQVIPHELREEERGDSLSLWDEPAAD